jgi:hypothetical protein
MNLERLRRAEEAFLHRFPGGFKNPEIFATRVRKHKPDQMIALAQECFSPGNFRHPDLIVQNMAKLINRSSIISVFEKPKFRDFAHALPPKSRVRLAHGLRELLHEKERAGFETLVEMLKDAKLAKWPLVTVCQTYFHPQRDVFVKPTTVKGVIEFFELENLQYNPTPSWAFYDTYRSAFHGMKAKVDKSLSPTNAAFSGFLWMTIRGEVF